MRLRARDGMQPFEVRASKTGKGLFATQDLPVGTTILRMRGPRISYASVLRMRRPDNAFQVGLDRYLDLQEPGVLANHSCNPNAGVTPSLTLVAIRRIRCGEEITYDYSACMDPDTVCDFRCRCGARSCRRIIRGFATLPKRRQSYLKRHGVVQRFLSAAGRSSRTNP